MSTRFNTAYAKHERSQLAFVDSDGVQLQGRTQQCFKQQCDVTNIIRQYDKTGLITHVNQAKAMYGDYTEVNEYQDALNLVIDAQDAFDSLPSAIRARFGHDPGAFFEFATNPENSEEMVKLGLATPSLSAEPPPAAISEPPKGGEA